MYSLLVFKSQVFGHLVSLVQDLRVGVPDVELKSLTPQGKRFVPLRSLLPAKCCPLCISVSALCLIAVPQKGHPVSVHPVSQSPSEGMILYVVVDLLCPWEELSSGFSYTSVLNLSSTSVFLRDTDLQFSFDIFVRFWYQDVIPASKNELGNVYAHSIFWEAFQKIGGNSSLNIVVEFTSGAIWFQAFLCRNFILLFFSFYLHMSVRFSVSS